MELLVVIAIVAILVALVLPALGKARKAARLAICNANLQQHGVGTATYAQDFKDFLWGYSWTESMSLPTEFPDLRTAVNNHEAVRCQYVDALRRRANLSPTEFRRETTLIPQLLYSHVVLMDYLAARLPEPIVVCPENRVRLEWARNPREAGSASPPPPDWPGAGGRGLRWGYSSSYELTGAAWDSLQSQKIKSPAGSDTASRRVQNLSHFIYTGMDNATLGQPKLASVVFPSQKVLLYEDAQRHSAKERYYASKGASTDLLFFDGSVAYKSNSLANPGWTPRSPRGGPHEYDFIAAPWQPPTATGAPNERVKAYFRWTRGGLAGLDFGGKEIDTGQPRS